MDDVHVYLRIDVSIVMHLCASIAKIARALDAGALGYSFQHGLVPVLGRAVIQLTYD